MQKTTKVPNVTCSHCAKQVYKKPSKINEGLNFCSSGCMADYRLKTNFRNQERTCTRCESKYFPTYEPQVYCSRSCSMFDRGEEKTELGTFLTNCGWCNKEIRIRNSAKGKTGNFCSVLCGEAQKRGFQEKTVTKKCKRCEEDFESLYRLQQEYCSQKCASPFQPGEEHIGFGKEGTMKGIRPWTFRKTAQTDDRIAALGKKISIVSKRQFQTGERNHYGIRNPNYGITREQRTPEQLENYSRVTWLRYNTPEGSGFGFLKGFYTSSKTNKTMRYRSSYEQKIMLGLDNDKNIKTYDYEPFALKYTNVNRYYPDFLVEYINGTKKLIEAKGYVENENVFNLKNAAAIKFCQENNMTFEIWKKQEVKEYYKKHVLKEGSK